MDPIGDYSKTKFFRISKDNVKHRVDAEFAELKHVRHFSTHLGGTNDATFAVDISANKMYWGVINDVGRIIEVESRPGQVILKSYNGGQRRQNSTGLTKTPDVSWNKNRPNFANPNYMWPTLTRLILFFDQNVTRSNLIPTTPDQMVAAYMNRVINNGNQLRASFRLTNVIINDAVSIYGEGQVKEVKDVDEFLENTYQYIRSSVAVDHKDADFYLVLTRKLILIPDIDPYPFIALNVQSSSMCTDKAAGNIYHLDNSFFLYLSVKQIMWLSFVRRNRPEKGGNQVWHYPGDGPDKNLAKQNCEDMCKDNSESTKCFESNQDFYDKQPTPIVNVIVSPCTIAFYRERFIKDQTKCNSKFMYRKNCGNGIRDPMEGCDCSPTDTVCHGKCNMNSCSCHDCDSPCCTDSCVVDSKLNTWLCKKETLSPSGKRVVLSAILFLGIIIVTVLCSAMFFMVIMPKYRKKRASSDPYLKKPKARIGDARSGLG